MGITICLAACALALGQTPDRGAWSINPQLAPGLELVYSGTFTEKSVIPNVQTERTYRLENHIFVTGGSPKTWDVAFMSALTVREPGLRKEGDKEIPNSVRLELATVDAQGHLGTSSSSGLVVPLEGPPTLECGQFVETPSGRLTKNQTWIVAEPNRPPCNWQFQGVEPVNGVTCLKLTNLQKSDDWDHPRADHTAWRRQETVWIIPQLGVAYKVERTIEHRDPAHREPTQIREVQYELQSRLTYTNKLLEDRRQEVLKIARFHTDAQPLLKQPALYHAQLESLFHKLTSYLDSDPPMPYRAALVYLQHRLDGARRGEAPPEFGPETNIQTVSQAIAIGQHLPDFVVTDLTGKKPTRLNSFLGQPVLLFFYNPAAATSKEVLSFVQNLLGQNAGRIQVVGLALTKDANFTRAQQADMKLTFPVLDGQGLHRSFGVDATPHLILLDGEGIVRGTYTGWGVNTATDITEELARCLR